MPKWNSIPYNPSNWYWNVAGTTDQVFSSASGSFVSTSDATYEAWVESGGLTTNISANNMLVMRIQILEDSITERMKQEALAGSTDTFGGGKYAGKTAAEAIAEIVQEKDTLRSQFTN